MTANPPSLGPLGFAAFRASIKEVDWSIVCSWNVSSKPHRPLGSKVHGLLGLPSDWVPVWFVLVPATSDCRDPRDLEDQIQEHFRGVRTLIVRSNGPLELVAPAEGASKVICASWDALAEAVPQALLARPQSWPLIQAAVEPSALGILGNDRTASPRRSRWIAEGPLTCLHPDEMTIDTAADPVTIDERPLEEAGLELEPVLRRIAETLGGRSGAQRCEWVWNGQRVWIVQADQVAEPQTDAIAQRYLGSTAVSPSWDAANPADTNQHDWESPKVGAWRFFVSRGWPVQPLSAVRAAEWSPKIGRRWLEDQLAQYSESLVIRSDLIGSDEGLLLPTSEPSRNVEHLSDFIEQMFSRLARSGHRDDQIVALASPLVPAHVSALANVNEDTDEVHIDAIWGFPDGLSFLPCDKYIVKAENVQSKIVFKPACLLLTPTRGRVEVRLGEPFDCGSTLRDDEVRQIARWARETAHNLPRPVGLMALARIAGLRGSEHCMPFHALAGHEGAPARTPSFHRRGQVVSIREPAGLRQIPSEITGIRLRPRLPYARDLEFLHDVASVAKAHGVPVYFQGSRLGHARFVLEKDGATVVLDHPRVHRGLPVLARTADGLMRLRELDAELACNVLAAQLNERVFGTSDFLTKARQLAQRVIAEGNVHPNFPQVALIRDDFAAQLPPTEDQPGQPARFMDDEST